VLTELVKKLVDFSRLVLPAYTVDVIAGIAPLMVSAIAADNTHERALPITLFFML